jgi:2-polyprenyl-6-hydroxyphenyl methylase/3-demethylubiquinone-9 3-methyltransferase
MVAEYAYRDDAPRCTSAYLWPELQSQLARRAPPPRRLFELGCGNGATARMLAGRGYDVVGVDPSASGVEIARRHAGPGLRFERASTGDDLRARFGTFPVVLSLEVIEHCPSPREFMRSFLSVLAPDGVGILSTPYHGYLKNLAVVAAGRFDRHFDPLWEAGHVRFFSLTKLRTLFAEFDLRPLAMRRVGRIPVLAKSVLAVVSPAAGRDAPRHDG